MNSLTFSEGNTSVTIDRNGFTLNGRRINWNEIQSCKEETKQIIDLGIRRWLELQLASEVFKIENYDSMPYMAVRIVLKETLPDKVTLDGPRYMKFGPEECEFTLSIAKFLNEMELRDESKFAYETAVDLIEYYHNPKHKLLIEPLSALASLLKDSDPDKAKELQNRARAIESAPAADKGLLQGVASAWSKKDRIKQALEEFRTKHGREPKPVEKARILKAVETE